MRVSTKDIENIIAIEQDINQDLEILNQQTKIEDTKTNLQEAETKR